MPDSTPLYSHSAHVIEISDMPASLTFYEKQLGFEVSFIWNDPPDYAVLHQGDVQIHLMQTDQPIHPTGFRMMYVFVHDVDSAYQKAVEAGAKISSPIETKEYGMRDYEVQDPDGHRITFGMNVNHST